MANNLARYNGVRWNVNRGIAVLATRGATIEHNVRDANGTSGVEAAPIAAATPSLAGTLIRHNVSRNHPLAGYAIRNVLGGTDPRPLTLTDNLAKKNPGDGILL